MNKPLRRLVRALVFAAAVTGGVSLAAEPAITVTSPQALPAKHDRPWVFLGGTIDMGASVDWQAGLTKTLGDLDVVFLNPRRRDWDPAWRPEAGEPHFRQQVQWELAALEAADVIVMYLAPKSQSPVSLLELGLHARSGKLIVLCPEGFWRKGNVDLTASAYGVEQVATLDRGKRVHFWICFQVAGQGGIAPLLQSFNQEEFVKIADGLSH